MPVPTILPVSTPQDTATRLAEVGHRLTGPRRAVIDAIGQFPGPFTIEELTSATPGVGRATVFRTVKLLQEAEVVCRMVLEDGGVRYELSGGGHHHHLICSICGAVAEFGDPELDALIQENANAHAFALGGHSLELYGRCASCG
jgi:Fe2+ or Zn2+ uptake regulation protein